MNFKKIISSVISLGILSLTLVGCTSETVDDKTIVVGATVAPHAEILNGAVKDVLAEKGYTLKVVEYNDYVLPNIALRDGEIDANYFQHQPFLDKFNKENNGDCVSVAKIHFEPLGIYSKSIKDINDIKDGATIAIPNDSSNQARALLLLQAQGLITLNEQAGLDASLLDIKDNSKNIEFKEIEAAQLVRIIDDVDAACINGNYAIEGGLSLDETIATEDTQSEAAQTYGNIIAVKSENQNSEKIKALVEAFKNEKVKNYINDNYNGAVIPLI